MTDYFAPEYLHNVNYAGQFKFRAYIEEAGERFQLIPYHYRNEFESEETRFLRDAARAGAVTVGGKWMLIAQAVEQIRTWTGREAPADVMARAFDRAGG